MNRFNYVLPLLGLLIIVPFHMEAMDVPPSSNRMLVDNRAEIRKKLLELGIELVNLADLMREPAYQSMPLKDEILVQLLLVLDMAITNAQSHGFIDLVRDFNTIREQIITIEQLITFLPTFERILNENRLRLLQEINRSRKQSNTRRLPAFQALTIDSTIL